MFDEYYVQNDQNDRELQLIRMHDEITEENDELSLDFEYDYEGL